MTGPFKVAEPHIAYYATTRAMDIVVSALLLVLATPVMALACVAIIIGTGEAPLLRQKRVGHLGREFVMLKLRTMHTDTGEPGDQPLGRQVLFEKTENDPRVSRIGRVLRKASIDELPQLVNVLAGQMRLVGPRPALPEEVARYPRSWNRRLAVKPGLTGLWQVSGRSSVRTKRRMAMDRYYASHRSLQLDLSILVRTVGAVVSMRGAW